ncbi:elongation factor G [Silvibacterium bohemicum]|uniref:Elongation factor G n=1 Tax=Silvibacterium bohemicum TaxID=1577686 RepID=A0A841JZW5_9BACT|nr:elongation factor G [Silvibacterium bohemicum]MBB6145907.1 elongation factor G [Silvibacterium bohemicum]
MKSYPGNEIRNVAVVGHAHSGKTTLVSALLHAAKMTPRLGRVEDGSAITAYDEEEISRRTTMQNAVAFAEWNGVKVNLVDTPGFHMFVHEAKSAMMPVESALLVVNTPNGVEAMTERVWKYAEEFNLPRVVVLNQMDHPRASESVHSTIAALRSRFGRNLIPVQLPIANGNGFEGIVDLVTMEAFYYTPGGDGSGKIGEIPEGMKDTVKAAHEVLVELVAEGKDELMEEFFAEGTIPEQHLITALHEAIREDRIFPVLFASGGANIATDHLLDFLKVYVPAPAERSPIAARAVLQSVAANGHALNVNATSPNPEQHEFVMRKVEDQEPVSLFAYKTMTDPFAGRITFFKVFSGVLKNDAAVENYSRRGTERFSHLSIMQGHSAVPVMELHAGDLGAVAKLKDTFTCDTLGEKGHEIFFEPVCTPEAAMTYAIEPKTRADEDKLAPAVHKIMEEDLLVRFFRDPQTNEFLIAGAGQPHIEAIVSKLRRRYHTEVTLKAPKVPYRETIRGRAEAQGRHKKQTGGHGQFGDCKIRIEPLPRGSGFEFVNDIFGGSIPRQYVPAVEKGIQESAARGYLAGYPVVDFKVTVYDGSYHEVDSNELSFKMAGRIAFRKCMEQARPALLEPVMKVEIEAPDEFAGALMGDLNQRRGRVQGMEGRGTSTLIRAEAPMSEMLSYGQALTAMTQGRGSFHMEMDHYDVVPPPIAEKILATAGRRGADEDEE